MTIKILTRADEIAARTGLADRYVGSLLADGVPAHVANVRSEPFVIEADGRSLPATQDDGEIGGSYVSCPHSAYALYARREIDLVGLRGGRTAAICAVNGVDRLLRLANINRAVHVDNWLLSTNLHDGWGGEGLPAIRSALEQQWPDHFIILRSLDPWSSEPLMSAARRDGWKLLPARQIWVTDDLERQALPRTDMKNDFRLARRSDLIIEDITEMSAQQAERIAELYTMLYVGRYSDLNPVFTAAFVMMTHRLGLARYRVARTDDGVIMAVSGVVTRGGVATTPIVGYDTSRPQSEGHYRICNVMLTTYAMESGLRLHLSAGAGQFKRTRGARPVIEYMAISDRHLSRFRRTATTALSTVLNRMAVPMLQKAGW